MEPAGTHTSVLGVIPARYESTRLPAKVLLDIGGVPMIEWVARGASAATRLSDLVIATDDVRVAEAVRPYGRQVVMTDPAHASGTDRVAEAAAAADHDLVINIQGDEPLVQGPMIDALIDALAADPALPMATLAHRASAADLEDPDTVKVVCDAKARALYFSRAAIPWRREPSPPGTESLRHIGIYGYRREFLLRFAALAPTPLERTEALEQLRALEHGYSIGVVEIEGELIGVDTPADLERVRAILAGTDLL
jgi:3-deoxy-manno-octulosonate cytidylyltransferase (CMP-KDO synthetase)